MPISLPTSSEKMSKKIFPILIHLHEKSILVYIVELIYMCGNFKHNFGLFVTMAQKLLHTANRLNPIA